jgi:hypothetical protein
MDRLNKLTRAGLSFFDGNQEYFDSVKWEETPLGARKSWGQPTISFVSLLATLPHPAAVFWGEELSQVGNLSWGHASETYNDQGKSGEELYPGEGNDLLQKCHSGRTVTAGKKVVKSLIPACLTIYSETSCFLTRTPEYGKESHILLSPILDDENRQAGVFAQLLANARRDPEETHELYLPGGDDDEKQEETDDGEDDSASERTTPTGAEHQADNKKEAGSPKMALESVGTKDDDEEYFKKKRQEGKNEDGPEEGDENTGGHFNEKPSKRPIFMSDGQKLDLKVPLISRLYKMPVVDAEL